MTPPPIDLRLPEAAKGAPILEAACLPDGAALVALGEAGAALYRGGQMVTRFRAPAHHLSVADDGRRAIAIAQGPNDDRCWIARLDLETGAEASWGDIARDRTNRYARTFDDAWYIAFERNICEITVQAVDTTALDFNVLTTVEETGMLVGVERTKDRLWVEATSIGAAHYTLYALPRLKRVARGDIVFPRIRFPPRPDEPFELFAGSVHPPIAAEPVFAVWGSKPAEPRLMGALPAWTAPLPGAPLGPCALRASGPWVSAAVEVEDGCQILAMDLRSRSFTAVLRFPGATAAAADLRGEALIGWDNRGRAAVIDLGRGEVLQTIEGTA